MAEDSAYADFKFGEKVTDLHDPVARKNFRVVVIRPEEIDQVDLTDYGKGQRWKWTLSNGDGQWHKIELWP
jgi:pyridoxamine 5'-phosphate oxidase